MRNKDEKHYRGIEKLTDNPFLNLYHIDALGRDGTPFHYYFASRNGEDNIKHKTHSLRPEGMAVYAVTEDGQHLVLVRQYRYPMDDDRAGRDGFGGCLPGDDRGDRLGTEGI